ncbi:MAG: response regulator transcription factor [Spirochaetales bacterium]|nr:response regulator transcription factor [Spirochaetales bacterium]MDY5915360.1 response regulator transcription factor [Treponema sp.]
MNHNLFLVDDHSMLRKGIISYLEEKTNWTVSGNFSDSKSCLAELNKLEKENSTLPEIIIIDIQLGKESGFNLVSAIKNSFPQIKIVIYSMFDTIGFKLQAKDTGAEGFISKASSDYELIKCLNLVKNGGNYFEESDISIQKELDSIIPFLKTNEKRVFELILQGKNNEQISEELFLGLHTVENYVSYIFNISNCKNRKQLIEKFK